MSKQLINQYYSNLDRVLQFGKSTNEQSIRIPFFNLLNEYARKQYYEVIAEISCMGTKGSKVRPDGIVKNLFGLDIGLWESKDEKDTIDDEINAKQKKGYPFTNILFEDSKTAVLIQRGEEVMRVNMRDADKLHNIITGFFSFKSDIVYKFEDALVKFKADIPTIVETLRNRIEEARNKNKDFIAVSETFLELCKAEINPDITAADVREMIIQHILTSDIFNKIFDDPEFHRHNNIAHELEKLIETLFNYSERKNLLGSIEHYYDAIKAAASSVADHHDKQKFLKVLYENFYKVYNPKAADRLGVVYTPNEIVSFMIESVNHLLEKHFNKTLSDKNVEILDPAAGTGTFITSIIDSIPKHDLVYKYQNEIHANEVAILPYYVANLNMEFTFKQKMGYYEEFKNLCFVDTLDNTDALAYSGKQHNLFGLSSENTKRIKRQNTKKISVIIGNPPYNANQLNENENNKNREYPAIDKRIKDTYIKHSTAQKTKVYDMYARFYRWASDRVDKDGIVCFISNNSYINGRGFDGFRKSIQNEFSFCYIVDLGGNIRENYGNKNSPIGNVFDIQVGVAIMFLIKKEKREGICKIEYFSIDDTLPKEEKLDWLHNNKLEDIVSKKIIPDKNNNWINLSENNDWETFLPLVDKKHRADNINKTVFDIFANGLLSSRDEWVYDFEKNNLIKKMKYFHDEYNFEVKRWIAYKKENNYEDKSSDSNPVVDRFLSERNLIKWSKMIKRDKLRKEKIATFDSDNIIQANYKPFIKKYTCDGYIPFDVRGSLSQIFHNYITKKVFENKVIGFIGNDTVIPFTTLVFDKIYDLNSLSNAASGNKGVPLYRYDEEGYRIDNITDWGLEQFVKHYLNYNSSDSNDVVIKEKRIKLLKNHGNQINQKNHSSDKGAGITKEDIFHYTYAVLHNPAYRKKYELNLKREFPRLPFYKDFWQWAKWGKQLMDLHINYETVEPFPLKEHTYEVKAEAKRQKEIFTEVKEAEELYARQTKVKAKLKADKEAGTIEIDELTFLTGVPKETWEYKLGNRSALEWVLDQYKEKKPTDPTIAEKFNTYRFADYKEKVIDLLKRVCNVSVQTVNIIKEMQENE